MAESTFHRQRLVAHILSEGTLSKHTMARTQKMRQKARFKAHLLEGVGLILSQLRIYCILASVGQL